MTLIIPEMPALLAGSDNSNLSGKGKGLSRRENLAACVVNDGSFRPVVRLDARRLLEIRPVAAFQEREPSLRPPLKERSTVDGLKVADQVADIMLAIAAETLQL